MLGIDPGTQVVGWGALAVDDRSARLVGVGVIRARRGAPVWQRLGEIREGLDRLCAEQRPSVVVVEEAFAKHNVQTALRIGEARGVVISTAVVHGATVAELPPAVAKKTIVGHGGAAKEQVAAMVCRMLSLRTLPEPLDATDALALALAHILRSNRAGVVPSRSRPKVKRY